MQGVQEYRSAEVQKCRSAGVQEYVGAMDGMDTIDTADAMDGIALSHGTPPKMQIWAD